MDLLHDNSLLSHLDMDWGRISCFLFEMMGETAPQMFHNASIWLTLVLAAQRYIYICQATRSVRGREGDRDYQEKLAQTQN